MLVGVFSLSSYSKQQAKADLPLQNNNDSVDLFTIGDSWTSVATQAGSVSPMPCTNPIFSIAFYGLPTGACPPPLSIYLLGADMKAGLSPQGVLRDRLNARGIPYNKVNWHQFAIGGSVPSDFAGYLPQSLQRQDATGDMRNLADQLAVSSKPIVFMTLGGNNIFRIGVTVPATDLAGWDSALVPVQQDIDKMIQFMINVNPNVEIVIASYTNFRYNDGQPSQYPPTGNFGFCRAYFGSHSGGPEVGFWATSQTDYYAKVNSIIDEIVDQAIANNIQSYIYNNMYRVNLSLISYEALVQEATSYWQSQRSDMRSVYYNNPLSGPWTDPRAIAAAFAPIDEQTLSPAMQRLDIVYRNLQNAHKSNVKYFPAWTALSSDTNQPLTSLSSPPDEYWADCLHMNIAGYQRWLDKILNDWLPTSRYLKTR